MISWYHAIARRFFYFLRDESCPKAPPGRPRAFLYLQSRPEAIWGVIFRAKWPKVSEGLLKIDVSELVRFARLIHRIPVYPVKWRRQACPRTYLHTRRGSGWREFTSKLPQTSNPSHWLIGVRGPIWINNYCVNISAAGAVYREFYINFEICWFVCWFFGPGNILKWSWGLWLHFPKVWARGEPRRPNSWPKIYFL